MSEAGSGASVGRTDKPIGMNKLIYFFGSLGAIIWGYDTGVIGSALLFIREDLALGPFMQGLVVSGLPIGAAIGALGGPLADGLGRRRLIILAALVFGLGGIGTALSVNAAMLVAFRIVMGMGIGISSVVVPLYLSEMAPTEIRGALATLNNLMIVIG